MAKSSTTADTSTADDLKREQTKGAADPVTKPAEPTKAKTMEEHGVGATDPYPQGSPPDPEDQFFAAHGYRRAKE